MPRYDHPHQSCNIAHWSIFDLTPSVWLSPRWVMAYLPETLLYLCLPRDWDKSVGSSGRMKLGLGAVSFFYARPAQASLLLVHVLVVLWLAASYKCNRHLEIVMFFYAEEMNIHEAHTTVYQEAHRDIPCFLKRPKVQSYSSSWK